MDNTSSARPVVQLSGEDGSIFSILGRCTKALKRAGMDSEAARLTEDVMGAGSYGEALGIIADAVEIA